MYTKNSQAHSSAEEGIKYNHCTFYTQSSKSYNKAYISFIKLAKNDLWLTVLPVIEGLKRFRDIEWDGPSSDIVTLTKANYATIREKGSATVKNILAQFAAAVLNVQSNTNTILNYFLTERGLELAKNIVLTGAMSFSEIYKAMGWTMPKPDYYYYSSDSRKYNSWFSSGDTFPLSIATRLEFSESDNSTNAWCTFYEPYAIPDPNLAEFVFSKLYPKIEITKDPREDYPDLIFFEGSDFPDKIAHIKALFETDAVPLTQGIVGKRGLNLLAKKVPIKQFPDKAKVLFFRDSLVYNLVVSAISRKSQSLSSITPSELLRATICESNLTNTAIFKSVISTKLRLNYYNSPIYYEKALCQLFNSTLEILKEIYSSLYDGWIPYEPLIHAINRSYIKTGYNYLRPFCDSNIFQPVQNSTGSMVYLSSAKEYFHDNILCAMVVGLAAVGVINVLFDTEGNFRYVQMSDIGKWFTNIIKELPKDLDSVSLSDSISIDFETGTILVIDPDFPYISHLANVAEPISSSRYIVSEKQILKNCHSVYNFNEIINNFKAKICPEPKGRILNIFNNVSSRINHVKGTGNSISYIEYAIDPKDKALHQFILSDQELKKYTIPLDGYRLIVEARHTNDFRERLADAGFLFD